MSRFNIRLNMPKFCFAESPLRLFLAANANALCPETREGLAKKCMFQKVTTFEKSMHI